MVPHAGAEYSDAGSFVVRYFDHLTDHQLEVLAALERGLVGVQTRSAERLMTKWAECIGEVEAGYECSIYDYTNDVDVRDLLHRLVVEAPTSLRVELERVIKPFDDRFRAATEPARKPLRVESDDLWWWQRVPTVRDGEFGADLARGGFLAV